MIYNLVAMAGPPGCDDKVHFIIPVIKYFRRKGSQLLFVWPLRLYRVVLQYFVGICVSTSLVELIYSPTCWLRN